jgi:hypothetical protein
MPDNIMQNKFNNLFTLIKHVASLLLIYSVCRLLFYLFNLAYFSDLSIWQLLYIMVCGVRFDISVIILTNAFFIILYLLPFTFREKSWYRIILKWLFVSINSIAMLANCIDLAYFQFTLKRTTADVFNFFGGGIGNDLGRLLPLFLKEYWYVFIIWGCITYLIYRLYKRQKTISN